MALAIKHAQCAPVTGGAQLYACPASTTALVRNIVIANIDGTNACDVTVEITDSSAAVTRSVISTYSLAAEQSLTLPGPFALEASDSITITAGADNDLEATAAVLQIT